MLRSGSATLPMATSAREKRPDQNRRGPRDFKGDTTEREKVSELTKGAAEFTVKGLRAGYHAFSVLGTDGKGTIRPSNPVLVVVR